MPMVAIKAERGGGGSRKAGGGGGGGGGGKGCGGNSNSNNAGGGRKNGPLPRGMYKSNKDMMDVLRCDEIGLDLLKHGAVEIMSDHPDIHHKQLRWELSDREAAWAEMLSGHRWEGVEYPNGAGFESDVDDVMVKIKSLAKRKIREKKEKSQKKRNRQDGAGVKNEDGYGGGGSGDDGGGGGGNVEGYMMSGGLRNATPGASRSSPAPFRDFDWQDTGKSSGQRDDAPRTPSRGTTPATGERTTENDLYESTPPPPTRPRAPYMNTRMNNVRAAESRVSPTPLSRHPNRHTTRMFQEVDGDTGFVGVFDAPPRGRALFGRPDRIDRRGRGGTFRGGETARAFIDLSGDD